MIISFLHYIIFVILILYCFFKTISYAIYEIKQESNKSGGIIIICFSIICVIISIIALYNL